MRVMSSCKYVDNRFYFGKSGIKPKLDGKSSNY